MGTKVPKFDQVIGFDAHAVVDIFRRIVEANVMSLGSYFSLGIILRRFGRKSGS